MSSRGLTILSIGDIAYGKFAYNLAVSIKEHCNYPIQVVHDKSCLNGLTSKELDIFDAFVEIKREDFMDQIQRGKGYVEVLNPAKAKINIYNYLIFDETLFIDADSLCVRDLFPLFTLFENIGKHYLAHFEGYCTAGCEDFQEMLWAYPADIWEKYNLDRQAILPAINSSVQYIRKGKDAEKLFTTVVFKTRVCHEPAVNVPALVPAVCKFWKWETPRIA